MSFNAGLTVATVYRQDGRSYYYRWLENRWTPDSDVEMQLTKDGVGFILKQEDGATERYDTSGRLLSETDPTGKTTGFTYDGNGKLISVTGPFGHVLTLGYNASGRLASVSDLAGMVHSYGYDASGNLVTVTRPDSSVRTYHYENSVFPHHLTGITDENGSRFATYAYDANGKAISTEHAGGQQRFTLAYDSTAQTTVADAVGTSEVLSFAENLGVKNLLSRMNQSDGKGIAQIFDARNNLTCRKDAEGRVTTYSYNATNQRLSRTEGQSGDCASPVATTATRTTSYQYLSPTLALPTIIESPSVYSGAFKRTSVAYDANKNPVTITRSGYTPTGTPVSRTTNLAYNAQGQVVSIDGARTDVSDVTALSYYDCVTGTACGQVKTLTNALGQATTYDAYDAAGRLLQKTDSNGLKTVYAYDSRGRLTSVSQSASSGTARSTQYAYDAAGNLLQVSFPDGRVLSYGYDAAHQLTSVTDNLGNKVEYQYDLKGNRIQSLTKDPDGTLVKSLETAYDLRNRVNQINEAGSLTQQVLDAVGNLVQTTDPNNNAPTVHEYDALDRLLRTVDALGGNTSYGHDPNDQITQVTAPNGASTAYETDDLGHRLKEVSPDRGTIIYSYDEAGNLKTATDARGIAVSYGYDALNRITLADYPGAEEDVNYGYDTCANGKGRLCRITDASGITDYAYDGFGNVLTHKKTELGVAYTTGYGYDLGDRVSAISYPDGMQVNYTRDALGRITGVSTMVNGVTQTLVSNRSYRADGVLTGQTYGNGLAEARSFDLRGLLTQQVIGPETWQYTYDANGNLLSRTVPSASIGYGYDALDRLTGETSPLETLDYAYDGNGNRITRTENGTTVTYSYTPDSNRMTKIAKKAVTLDTAGNTVSDRNGNRTFDYDSAGHLKQVSVNGETRGSYSYNSQHQRTRKVKKNGAVFQYHYDLNGRLLAESRNGQPWKDYVWVDDEPVAQVKVHKNAKGKLLVKDIVYLTSDHLNTPRIGTDANAQVVWRWEGDAFGDTRTDNDPDNDDQNVTVNLRFPGQYYDRETGLHYNWHRYYDPKTGRYVSSDPIGLEGGVNTFTYVENNPLRWIDLEGLMGSGSSGGRSAPGPYRFGGGGAQPGFCGAGWNEPFVPDAFGSIDLSKACGSHDKCYSKCGSSKLDCDLELQRDIMKECSKLSSGAARGFCKTIAVDYQVAVRTWGDIAFKKAQSKCSCD